MLEPPYEQRLYLRRYSHSDEVIIGCANQAGEDNRNIARMAALLSGQTTCRAWRSIAFAPPAWTPLGTAARAIRSGEVNFVIAAGVESMTRAPFVIGKVETAFQRSAEIFDTTLGGRFINPLMKAQYGVDSLLETGENVAGDYQITREDQDAFACRSQQRAARATENGFLAEEMIPVEARDAKGKAAIADKEEYPRPSTTLAGLAKLRTSFRTSGMVRAGNASGVNDGAMAMIIASQEATGCQGLTPRARIAGIATTGVAPQVMGIGPVRATEKLFERLGVKIGSFDIVELNEADASQSLAVLRGLGCRTTQHVNPMASRLRLGTRLT